MRKNGPVTPASVAQLDVHSTGDQEVAGQPLPGQQHSFFEIDHEIFSRRLITKYFL